MGNLSPMTEEMAAEEPQEWPTHCPRCGTGLERAVLDFDSENAPRPELRPGEMAAVDFCPNPECELHRQPVTPPGAGADALPPEDDPGSLGGDNGGA